MIWVGRILSGLASAFFVMDAVMKLIQPQFVIDSTRGIGWPADPMTLSILGCLLLTSTALYLFRWTAVLVAILLTGISAAPLRRTHASAVLCSLTTCSGSIWECSSGAGFGCGTPALERSFL